MHIDFIVDTTCIWSFIAKRRLETALADFSGLPVNVSFYFFSASVPYSPFPLNIKIGAGTKTRLLKDRIDPILRETGIRVNYDLLPEDVDPKPAERFLIEAAARHKGMEALEEIFKTFFEDGLDTGSPEVIEAVAKKCALPVNRVARDSQRKADEIAKDPPVNLPSFIFDGRCAVFGTQSVECFKNMIATAITLENEKFLNDPCI